MAEKLEFDLVIGKNELTKTLDHTAKIAGSISNALSAGFGATPIEEASKAVGVLNSEVAGFIKNTAAVAAGQLAFSLISGAVNFLKESVSNSVSAFSEQEDAINKLNQALRTTGSFSESASEGVIAFSSALESSSKFGDDAIIAQVAFVKSLGATTQTSKDLVLAAANLSATLGGSLEENVDKLGKTLSGTAGRLAQYIPELKSLTEEQLRAGAAADIINSKFSGAAANDLNTYSGSMAALGNSFNNLQETLGEAIAKSGAFQGIITGAKKAVDDLNNSIATEDVFKSYSSSQALASKTSEQLANDTVVINKEIQTLQKNLEEQANRSSFSKFIFDDDTSAVIKKQIDDLVKLRQSLEERLTFGRSSLKKEASEKPVEISKSADEVEAERKKNEEIFAVNQKLQIDLAALRQQAQIQNKAIEDQDLIAKEEGRLLKQELEINALYEQEAAKLAVLTDAEYEKATLIQQSNERKLTQERIAQDASLKSIDLYNQKEKKLNDVRIKDKKLTEEEYQQVLSNSLSVISTLQTSGNKTLVAIGKAAALSQLAISAPVAVGKAFELGPILGPVAAAAMTAAFSVQAAKIAGVQFADGGFIPDGGGATTGADTVTAQVRPGEMVLNANQQKKLFDAISNGNLGGGGNIQVIIDGREVAIAVRNQIDQGFRMAV